MPSKRQFRRLRRLRLTGLGGVSAVGLGAVAVISASGDAAGGRPGGSVGVVVGLLLLTCGVVAVTWTLRTRDRLTAAEWQDLREEGSDDGLPLGAFRRDELVGLEASDRWLVYGVLTAGVGLVLLVAGATDPQVGWRFGLAMSLVGFLPAALCFRLGTGVKYWLTPDGVARRGGRRPALRWVDVERVVPLYRGAPTAPGAGADAVELQLGEATPGTPRRWSRRDFTIKLLLLEISPGDLLRMLHERVRQAQACR